MFGGSSREVRGRLPGGVGTIFAYIIAPKGGSNMNGQTYAFYRLYSSKANYVDGSPAPLPYCRRHKLHENPMPNTWAHCPWVNPELRAELLAEEHRIAEAKRNTPASGDVLKSMGLVVDGINTNAALKALRGMGL